MSTTTTDDDRPDPIEVRRTMSKDEFMALWGPRLTGLMINAALEPDEAKSRDTQRSIRGLLRRIYRSLTEPNYRPPKNYLTWFDKLGRLAQMFVRMDEENYIPASAFLDHDRF